MSKASKEEAHYTDPRNTYGPKRCLLCSMYLALSGTCTAVEGRISPLGRCKFWANALTGKDKPNA